MPHVSVLFLVAALTLNITPGPDMLYVITRSLSQGRTAGIISSLGIMAGCCVHVFAAALGLSSLLIALPAAFEVIRYAGAAYLIYLGIRTLMNRRSLMTEKSDEHAGLGTIFRQGAITNVLNPKVALFFLAFLPQFVDPSRGNLALQFIILGMIFNIGGTIVNVVVSRLAGRAGAMMRVRLSTSNFLSRWVPGGVFIGLGVRLALIGRK